MNKSLISIIKNAPTQRIKHVNSHPFPKTAKIGVLSAVLFLGMVLLPMAKAQKAEKAVLSDALRPVPEETAKPSEPTVAPLHSYKLSVLVRDKQERPLPGVEVAVEWVSKADWAYGELGNDQRSWPTPPVESVKVSGRAVAMTDGKGIARLSWETPDVGVGLLLSYRKDGYYPLSRSPMSAWWTPQAETLVDGPTLSPLSDCVTLVGKLVDAENGQAIKDARIVELIQWHYWRRRELWTVGTDGSFRITINNRNSTLNDQPSLAVQAAGYPIQRGKWLDAAGKPIEFQNSGLTAKTLEGVRVLIRKGVIIPGRVQTANGKPVSGARLRWEPVRFHRLLTQANEEGRFEFGPVLPREQLDNRRAIYVTLDGYETRLDPDTEYPKEWIIQLPATQPVRGKLVDEEGNPVNTASIAVGRNFVAGVNLQNGRFEVAVPVEDVRRDGCVIGVQAPGFAYQVVVWTGRQAIDTNTPPIILGKGLPCEGMVTDQAGVPIQKVWVVSEDVRGVGSRQYNTSTDMEGRFEFQHFPTNLPVNFSLLKEGYMALRDVRMIPGKTNQVFVMRRPLKISGQVVDAKNGAPIDNFKVIPGVKFNQTNSPISLSRRDTVGGHTGQYEIVFDEPSRFQGHAICVEADGYFPSCSAPFNDDCAGAIDFRLQKGPAISGVVLLPDGSPAVGAEVILCTQAESGYIKNGKNLFKKRNPSVESNPDGRFSFPPQPGPFRLAVLHDRGYAEITDQELAASPQVRLRAWGRIDGVVQIGNKPGAKEKIGLWFDESHTATNAPHLVREYTAQAGENGRFVFERVPPGKMRVGRMIERFGGPYGYQAGPASLTSVEVPPGETVHVTVGGKGRSVVGKIVPSTVSNIDWTTVEYEAWLRLPPPPYPTNFRSMTDVEQRSWIEKWRASKEGQAFEETKRNKQLLYSVEVGSDGQFHVDEIPAGMYVLGVNAVNPESKSSLKSVTPVLQRSVVSVGRLAYTFKVPEMLGGRSDEPLDLGVLTLESIDTNKTGTRGPMHKQ